MGENKFRILGKTSPILHSSFIIHHSSFSLSPLLLNFFVLHFFKPRNSYDSPHSFVMTNDAVISTEGKNLLRQESLSYP